MSLQKASLFTDTRMDGGRGGVLTGIGRVTWRPAFRLAWLRSKPEAGKFDIECHWVIQPK